MMRHEPSITVFHLVAGGKGDRVTARISPEDRSNAARRAPLDAGVPGPNLRIPASVGDRW